MHRVVIKSTLIEIERSRSLEEKKNIEEEVTEFTIFIDLRLIVE